MPVGAMTATGPFARRRVAVASRTSGRIVVASAGPGQVCSHGMMTWLVLPCRGADSTSTESSADTASGMPRPSTRPRRTPTSVESRPSGRRCWAG